MSGKASSPAASLQDIGRLPATGDNVAIAIRRLEAGSSWLHGDREFVLSHTVLEGHRFAVRNIAAAEPLLSWGLPFGLALRDIQPGEYVCNANVLHELGLRHLDFDLPVEPNFRDQPHGYRLDEQEFHAGRALQPVATPGHFMGYPRGAGRGTGTRNVIVVLGTSSRTASVARAVAARFQSVSRQPADASGGLDGVVAATHTEGAGERDPNNLEFVLRTLAGFIVHPNVAAVLALDYGVEAIDNSMLRRWMLDHDYPLAEVPHRFHTLRHDFAASVAECAAIVQDWLEPARRSRREKRPLSELRVALQCGGSDAFSGISGNPLAAWAAREVIRHGGSAGLAETDELIGAEPYILANTRDRATAERFLSCIETFRERIAWHGHSAEGNPSGGNLFRGLYNIALKSIGAARKKDPEVCLEHVIAYGERMSAPGFYFMDSPGNDLESIAGQVASGCNLIFFITGNGSITNFPFVPTVKFVTTTQRWQLLEHDMDINAGLYLDGLPMNELGAEAFDYAVATASGRRSAGERARHAQVSIWRDWHRSGPQKLAAPGRQPQPSGRPLPVPDVPLESSPLTLLRTPRGAAIERIGLIMPTSLCSGQVAAMIARRVESELPAGGAALSRVVALPHTEGCGASSGENEQHYLRTLAGHLVHPLVEHALLLEHGCEKTHNDLVRDALLRLDIDPGRFGYASIQLDGGIDRVSDRVAAWFAERVAGTPAPETVTAGLESVSLGLLTTGMPAPIAARALALLAASLAANGGTVVLPESTPLLRSADFLAGLGFDRPPAPTLAYGQPAVETGLHVMAAPTVHTVEVLTGLGGTGVQLILALVDGPPLQGHPMITTLQVAPQHCGAGFTADFDLLLPDHAEAMEMQQRMLALLCEAAAGSLNPRLWRSGNTDFQVTRGLSGVSL